MFEKLRSYLFSYNRYLFTEIYKNNKWGNKESVSGSGSTLNNTAYLIPQIESAVRSLNAKSFFDVPCGDYNWIRQVQFGSVNYLGGDIVSELIYLNNSKFKNEKVEFIQFDLTKDIIPQIDIIFIRDCLVHLSFKDIFKVIKNIQSSEAKYLITTTFTNVVKNSDIVTGGWRPINLESAPFNFPKPDFYLFEDCKEEEGKYGDKNLGVWSVESIIKITK